MSKTETLIRGDYILVAEARAHERGWQPHIEVFRRSADGRSRGEMVFAQGPVYPDDVQQDEQVSLQRAMLWGLEQVENGVLESGEKAGRRFEIEGWHTHQEAGHEHEWSGHYRLEGEASVYAVRVVPSKGEPFEVSGTIHGLSHSTSRADAVRSAVNQGIDQRKA